MSPTDENCVVMAPRRRREDGLVQRRQEHRQAERGDDEQPRHACRVGDSALTPLLPLLPLSLTLCRFLWTIRPLVLASRDALRGWELGQAFIPGEVRLGAGIVDPFLNFIRLSLVRFLWGLFGFRHRCRTYRRCIYSR